LALAALGLGFQQKHYALLGLAAATAMGFRYIDVLLKGYQMRYYPRMRDIELATTTSTSCRCQNSGRYRTSQRHELGIPPPARSKTTGAPRPPPRGAPSRAGV
jgi:hypothetical protein